MRKLFFLCLLLPFFAEAQQSVIETKINTELPDNNNIRAVALRNNLKAVLHNTQLIPANTYTRLTKNLLDSSTVAEFATGETYRGKSVYQRTFFGHFGSATSIELMTGIEAVIDCVGWTSADFYYQDQTQLKVEVWGFCKFNKLAGTITVTRDASESWIRNFRYQRTLKYIKL